MTVDSNDYTGLHTLDVIAKANRFNRWMYETILPYCKGKTLEIGSGTGNISAFFLDNGSQIFLSDINQDYCHLLKSQFGRYTNLSGIEQIDLADSNFERWHHLYGTFDTVFSLNVLEHIADDTAALKNACLLLKPGGKLILLVPAYRFLYCRFDKELGHYRRYNRKSLVHVVQKSGFILNKIFSFNFAGIAGWFLFGKLSGRKQIETSEMGIFNRLVPLFRWIDLLTFKKAGLSLIITATKPVS